MTRGTKAKRAASRPQGSRGGVGVGGAELAVLSDLQGAVGSTDLRWLRDRLADVVRRLGLDAPRLTVVLVDDARMVELHGRYAGKSRTTDVLTFDLSDDSQVERVEGEVYVCADEARRRAAELGHEPRLELLLYAVHGLLHLTGYDDRTAAEYGRMHCKEDALLRAIGVGPVFAPNRSRNGDPA